MHYIKKKYAQKMQERPFKLISKFQPQGDQPEAINSLAINVEQGVQDQILLGVTGSGKTFTMANVIARCQRPALILAPNKTLAGQLYNEFKELFPHNAVEYFVSYYDYYQPEAYVPSSDTFIEKDSAINDDLDKLRHAATHALLTRRDVIIIASVSCIYGLGSPEYYERLILPVEQGQQISMDSVMSRLVDVQYKRNDIDFHRGTFRVRGDVLEVIPAYEHERALRLEFFGDEIEQVREIDPLTGEILGNIGKTVIYPASHYVTDQDNLRRAMHDIRLELCDRLQEFEKNNQLIECQRLDQRTQLDLEMMQELGYCTGIENYSRHLDNRAEGEAPATLLDYFPDDFLLFADESHISIPQIGGMYKGDRSRKQTLVNFGFRLPSALDNRPLNFEEFLERRRQVIYVSATPGPWEINQSQGLVVEQIIRPTGLLDPLVSVRPVKGQIEDLLGECLLRIEKGERVLITTLTKRMAEDLTEYLANAGVATRYLHSDIDTMERMAIIKALRAKEFDVLVGINLLREGLDIPEVSLVAIIDADKEGFLRSVGSLIQTFGRAARHVNGSVIMYADRITQSMQKAMDETARRREKQSEWNILHNITPQGVQKALDSILDTLYTASGNASGSASGKRRKASQKNVQSAVAESESLTFVDAKQATKHIKGLEKAMREAATALEFEKAALYRDQIRTLREKFLQV